MTLAENKREKGKRESLLLISFSGKVNTKNMFCSNYFLDNLKSVV